MSSEVIELDCRAMMCPMPVIKLAGAAQEAEIGTIVRIHTDDPAARVDVPAWCRMRRHDLISRADDEGSPASTSEVPIAAMPTRGG